jgi:predicted nucleotidyltransferase
MKRNGKMTNREEILIMRMHGELKKIIRLKQPSEAQALEILYDIYLENEEKTNDEILKLFVDVLRRGAHKYKKDVRERPGRKSTFERGLVKGM